MLRAGLQPNTRPLLGCWWMYWVTSAGGSFSPSKVTLLETRRYVPRGSSFVVLHEITANNDNIISAIRFIFFGFQKG